MTNNDIIATDKAREIAALFQSPGQDGIGFAQFASTGTITEALLDNIDRELAERGAMLIPGVFTDAEECIVELTSLREYVNAQTVTVWAVGQNTAGYMPESDVTYALDYSDALETFEDMILEAPERFYPEVDTEDADDDYLRMTALVAAYIADEVPSCVGGRVFGTPRELSLSIRPEYLHLPTVFWVKRTEMYVSEYRECTNY